MEGVVDPVFLLLDLDFRGTADADDSHTACKLGQTLLELFPVIVRRGLFDLPPNLLAPAINRRLLAGTIDDGGFFFGDRDVLGRTKHVEGDIFQLDADIFGDDLASGQRGDVFEHGLAAVTEARRLDRGHFQTTTQTVDHQGGQRFALEVLGDDQQRAAGLHNRFQNRQQRL